MIELYFFFFTVKVVCIAYGTVYAYKLARIPFTDTPSNISIAVGYFLALLYQFISQYHLFLLVKSFKFIQVARMYGTHTDVLLQFIAMSVYIAFLYGTMRRYKFNINNKPI